MHEHSQNIVKSSEVIGVEVINSSGDDLGNIEEIVLDKISGQVCYVVLSFGGLLGVGDKYFAFPWRSIRYAKDDECFILDVDKDQLKSMQGFDKNNWPDMSTWPEIINKNYI